MRIPFEGELTSCFCFFGLVIGIARGVAGAYGRSLGAWRGGGQILRHAVVVGVVPSLPIESEKPLSVFVWFYQEELVLLFFSFLPTEFS